MRLVRRTRYFVYHQVLHADDPPHRLALGAAIGVFVAVTPTIGFQMMINVFLCWLLKANKTIGLPIVWVSNPATMVPIYYACYVVGRTVLRSEHVGEHWWRELACPPEGWWALVSFYWSRFLEIAVPLWTGSLVIAFLLAYPTYYGLFHVIRIYRLRRWGQLVPPTYPAFKPAASVFVDGVDKVDGVGMTPEPTGDPGAHEVL